LALYYCVKMSSMGFEPQTSLCICHCYVPFCLHLYCFASFFLNLLIIIIILYISAMFEPVTLFRSPNYDPKLLFHLLHYTELSSFALKHHASVIRQCTALYPCANIIHYVVNYTVKLLIQAGFTTTNFVTLLQSC